MEKKFNNIILVPTDFSEVCENAIIHGAEIARSLDFKLCLLHVVNRETKTKLKKEAHDVSFVAKQLSDLQETYQKKYKITVEKVLVEGNLFSSIHEVAREIRANMMVLGTHGKKGLQHVFGSYALRVVLESPVPVIVVQNKSFAKGYRRIVFPISNDLEPRQKVQTTLRISRLFDSTIHLFQSKEKDTALISRVSIITRQIKNILDENNVKSEVVTAGRASGFAAQVLSYSVLNKADLIMIMTQPNVDVPGFSLSEWDEKLMFNDAQIPVMLINPMDVLVNYMESSSVF
jgi:nucleotide-binding universal stress UspA family protein